MVKNLVELGFRIFVFSGIVYMISNGFTDLSVTTIVIAMGLLVIIGVPFSTKS